MPLTLICGGLRGVLSRLYVFLIEDGLQKHTGFLHIGLSVQQGVLVTVLECGGGG